MGYYTLSLVQALVRVGGDIEWVLFGVAPSLGAIPRGENIRTLTAKGLVGVRRVVWEQLTLPRLAVQAGVNLLHCPDFSRPALNSIPVVNTIHDLSYWAPQPFFSLAKRVYKRTLAHFTVARSQRIIAVSHFSREEILRRFHVDKERVCVIYNGVDPVSPPPRLGEDRPFLLFVGTLEERKNIVRLIQAWTRLRVAGRIPHRLVLVGEHGWGWQKILTAIRESAFRGDIEARGYVGRDKVFALCAAADLFVYPSLYEGFGLPVLEAMACGTPVICSRAASLPEVAGDAAEFFDPASSEDLAATIERVLGSAELRAALRRKGLERASKFSWDECGRRHCQVYRDLLGN